VATGQTAANHPRNCSPGAHICHCSVRPACFAVRPGATAPKPVPGAAGTLDTMAEQDEDEPTELDTDALEARSAGSEGWNNWVRRNFSAQRFLRPVPSSRSSAPAASADHAGLSPSERSAALRGAVNNLNPRERQIGFLALAFELALTAIVVVPYLTHRVKLSRTDLKTMSAVHFFLVEGLVVAIFLLLGTLMKRRALLGFASLATAIWLIELPALRVFGLAYLGLGMWLLVKGLKSQQNAARGSSRPSSQPRPSKRSRAQAEALATRSAPKANKRYTPPKPTRRPSPKKPASARAEPPK
jgi:hypothetical protein